jgi:hypothetical protein
LLPFASFFLLPLLLYKDDDCVEAMQHLKEAFAIFKENDKPAIEKYAVKLAEVEAKTLE